MPEIHISVKNKFADLAEMAWYVCDNSDYVAVFHLDEQWEGIEAKTARFQVGDRHQDVVFVGDRCSIPVFQNGIRMEIGIFTGVDPEKADMRSTTSAVVRMKQSVREGAGTPVDPPDGVYDQVMGALNQTAQEATQARDEAVEAAERAEISAEAAEAAKNSMTYVSMTIDENGDLVLYHPELLGTTDFRLDDGWLEVKI